MVIIAVILIILSLLWIKNAYKEYICIQHKHIDCIYEIDNDNNYVTNDYIAPMPKDNRTWVSPTIGRTAMHAVEHVLPISKHSLVFKTKSGMII